MRVLVAAPIALLSLLACGSDSGSGSGGGGGDDGKYHPDPNGQSTTEDAACNALNDAYESKLLGLKCAGTTAVCPSYLSSQFGDCLEYDLGTVQGCVAYYDKATTCDELQTNFKDCAVSPISGSDGKGCP
jgi:hypothetical protein